MAVGMTGDDRQILDFEAGWWRQPGAKEDAIVQRFGITPTRYYQRLVTILDDPDALAYAPTLVARLRRVRESRTVDRRTRRIGFDIT